MILLKFTEKKINHRALHLLEVTPEHSVHNLITLHSVCWRIMDTSVHLSCDHAFHFQISLHFYFVII